MLQRTRTPKPTTPAKTWGPFTGRQLTTIVCVLIVTVLFPVTAWAVSGTTVFVTDKATGKTAAVDANRNLQTKVNGGVSVSGTVAGNVAPTSSFVESHLQFLSVGTQTALLTPATGKEIIVTSVHVDWDAIDTTTTHFGSMTLGDAGTCANPSTTLVNYFDLPTRAGNATHNFVPGYIVPHGKSLCVEQVGAATPQAYMNAYGYTVPAGSVAAPAIDVAAQPHARR